MRSFSRSSTLRISPWPRQERQDRTGFRPQGPHHHVRHLILDARIVITAEVTRLDRKRAAFAGNDGSVAEKLRDPSAI